MRGDHDRRRICVVGSGWRFTSGISYYTWRLARALDAEDLTVSVVLMRRLIPQALYPGRARVGKQVSDLRYPATVDVYDGVDWFWGRSVASAVSFVRRRRPTLVVFQWWTTAVAHTYLLLAVVARLAGASVVVEVHEFADTGEARRRVVARIGRVLLSAMLRLTDAVVVHSDHDRHRLREGWPRFRGPVHLLPHGPFDQYADVDAEPAERADAAGESLTGALSDVHCDDTVLLFFGTIRPYKGLEHLVDAFGRLGRDEVRGLRLVIVGETWEGWTRPLDQVARSPHRHRITVLNRYVDDRDVGTLFRRADLVVLPYLRSSASGPLHIAMAHGLPVVVSDVGGLRDGAAGYRGVRWVPPGDPAALVAALRERNSLIGPHYDDPRRWDDSTRLYAQLAHESREVPA